VRKVTYLPHANGPRQCLQAMHTSRCSIGTWRYKKDVKPRSGNSFCVLQDNSCYSLLCSDKQHHYIKLLSAVCSMDNNSESSFPDTKDGLDQPWKSFWPPKVDHAKRRAGETALANLGPGARQARREAVVRLDATGSGNQPMRLGVSSWE
jgi:hypothetical protein